MIRVNQAPRDFHEIVHGRKCQVTIPTETLQERLKAGDIIRIGIDGTEIDLPTIDCIVTHLHDCVLAYFEPGTEDQSACEITHTEPTVIASIKRGISW